MSTFYTSYSLDKGKVYLKYVQDGVRKAKIVKKFAPDVFVRNTDGSPTPYKDIFGNPLRKKDFDTISQAKNFAWEHKDIAGFKIFGYDKWANQYIHKNFRENDWNVHDILIGYIDIENEVEHSARIDPIAARERINIITVKCNDRNRFDVFVLENEQFDLTRFGEMEIDFYSFETEKELLEAFLRYMKKRSFDVLSGWNIEAYDIPYIVNRVTNILGEEYVKDLSPFGKVEYREVQTRWGPKTVYQIAGTQILDYLEVYKKFVLDPRENYKLDYIAEVELKEKKLHHPSGIPGHLLYREYYNDFIKYNIQDVALIEKLEAKISLLALTFMVAYRALINYEDVLATSRIWDNLIYIYLADRNTYFEMRPPVKKKVEFEGAYCKPPVPGHYKWVVTFDVTSEYPSIIRAMNMSPETLVEGTSFRCFPDKIVGMELEEAIRKEMKEKNVTYSANGVCYTREFDGFMPELIRGLFATRIDMKQKSNAYEKKGDDNNAKLFKIQEKAIKVILNGLYGVMGMPYFRFYDVRVAEGITLTGQSLVRWVERDVNKVLNELIGTTGKDYCIAIDTDSCMFHMEPLIIAKLGENYNEEEAFQWIRKFCDSKIEAVIQKSLKNFAAYMNAHEPGAFKMGREVVADRGIYRGKKNYILHMLDKEGVEKKQMKIMGVEAIKAKTPGICRDKMKEVFPILLHGKEVDLQKFVSDFRKEFYSLAPEKIALSLSVNDTDYDLDNDKRIPINSRAAISFNNMLKELDLEGKYPKIMDAEKIKYVYLKMPNPSGNKVIGWSSVLPEEFELFKYIDYEDMFEKSFVLPIESLARLMGWSTKKRATLEAFFG